MPDAAGEAAREASRQQEELKRNMLRALREAVRDDKRKEDGKTADKAPESSRQDEPNISKNSFTQEGESLYNDDNVKEEDIPSGNEEVSEEAPETLDEEAPEHNTDEPNSEEAPHSEDPVHPETEPHTEENIDKTNRFEDLKEKYDHVKDVTLSSPEERGDKVREYTSYLKKETDKSLDVLKEEHPELEENIEKARDCFAEQLEQFGDDPKEKAKILQQIFKDNPEIKTAFEDIISPELLSGNPLEGTVKNGSEIIGSTKEDISELLEDLGKTEEDLTTAVDSLGISRPDGRSLSDSISEFLKKDDLAPEARETAEQLKEIGDKLDDAFEGMKKGLSAGTKEQAAEGVEKFNNAVDELKEVITRVFEKTAAKENDLSSIKNPLAEGIEDIFKEHSKDLGKEAEQNIESALKKLKLTKEQREGFAKTMGKILKGIGKTTVEVAKKSGFTKFAGAAALSNPWTAAVYVAVKMVVRTAEYAKDKITDMQKTGENALGDSAKELSAFKKTKDDGPELTK